MKEKKYQGFSSYLINHTITEEFCKDFNYWCKRIYKGWKFLTEYEDFYMICWEALLSQLPTFNPKVATIQTFCISRISNEAWRQFMQNKSKKNSPTEDITEPEILNSLYSEDTSLSTDYLNFSIYCNKLGFDVNIKQLDRYVQIFNKEGTLSDCVIAYLYWKITNGGDINMVFQSKDNSQASFIAMKQNVNSDKLISAYLIAGDSLFYLMKLFEGQNIEVPSNRKLNVAKSYNVQFIEDDERIYSEYNVKDVIEHNGKEYSVVAAEKQILNHYYIAVEEVNNDEQ